MKLPFKKITTAFRGKNLVILVLSVLIIALIAALAYSNGFFYGQGHKEKVINSAIKSLNDTLLKNKGVSAKLSGKVVEKSGVYQFKIKIGNQEFTSYLTKDGSLLFPDAIKLVSQTKEEKAKEACAKIKKSSNPSMEAFVVSYCPFGLQMERMISELAKSNPELMKYIKIRYIGSVNNGKISSMHGEKEAEENLKQICLREEQPDKYIPYISCFIKDGKSEQCSRSVGVDEEKLKACESNPEKGLAYAKKDYAEAENMGLAVRQH